MTTIEQILKGIEKGRTLYESVQGSVSALSNPAENEETAANADLGLSQSETTASGGLSLSEGAANADLSLVQSEGAANSDSCSTAAAALETVGAETRDRITGGEFFSGDNLEYMAQLLRRGYAGAFRLIYIDPPFFTRSSFNASVSVKGTDGKTHRVHLLAFDDKFDRSLEYYIENMTARLLMMRDLLADDGLLWVHLDWHSSHYIKLVLDELLGEKNFVNEIIWCYKSGGSGKRHFARKHDTILVYSKTTGYYIDVPEEKSYNRDRKPYRFKGVQEYCDELGWYTMVNMKDIWNIDMVGRTSAERTGYATQKPIELMKRIIEASSEKGDLAADFFCGSGSLLEAAHLLGRRWAGCDSEVLASSMTRRRLKKSGADFRYLRGDEAEIPSGRADIEILSREELTDGRFLYKCRLADLLPDIDTGTIQIKDRKYVEEALLADKLQFADYIMVDPGSEDPKKTDQGSPDDAAADSIETDNIKPGSGSEDPKMTDLTSRDHTAENSGSQDHVKADSAAPEHVGEGLEYKYIFDRDFDEMIFIGGSEPAFIVADIFGKEYRGELIWEQKKEIQET